MVQFPLPFGAGVIEGPLRMLTSSDWCYKLSIFTELLQSGVQSVCIVSEPGSLVFCFAV